MVKVLLLEESLVIITFLLSNFLYVFAILKFLTLLRLRFTAKLIGSDEYQNRYYESKSHSDSFGRKKRFCIYHGVVEGSKIPSRWHAWIHHTTIEPLQYKHLFWHKAHIPDVTGTVYAFRPNKHTQFNIYGKSAINNHKVYTAWDGTITE